MAIPDGPARAPDWLPLGGPPAAPPLPPIQPPIQPVATQPIRAQPIHPQTAAPGHGLPPVPRRRARWQSVCVSVLVVVAMFTGSAVVARALTPPTPYDTYLPPDGHHSWVRTPAGDGQVEQAVLRAAPLAELGPVAQPVLDDLAHGDGGATTFLRVTLTPSAHGPVSIWFAVTATTLQLSLVSSPNVAYALVPGLELSRRSGTTPAEQAGTATLPGGPSPYRADVTARVDAAGCRTVSAHLTVSGLTGAGTDPLSVTTTLCPGRGVTAFATALGGPVQRSLRFEPGGADLTGAFDGDLAVTPASWTDPGSFRPAVLTPQASNAFGTHAITGRPVQARPALTASGLLLVAGLASADVEAYRRDGPRLNLLWRIHPGGSITAITAVGDLLVVATSEAKLAAYRPDGTLAWSTAVTEQVVDSLLPLPGAVSFATLDGGVYRIDASTGAVVWRQELAAGVNRALVGDARFVLVADTAGGVFGWVPNGQQVFHGQVREPFTLLVINAEVNFLLRGQTIEGYEQQHSSFLWSATLAGLPTGGCGLPGQAVLAMAAASVGLDQQTGGIVWTAPGADDVQCAGTAVLLSSERSATIVTADGTAHASIELPQTLINTASRGAVVGPDAAWLVLADTVVRLG